MDSRKGRWFFLKGEGDDMRGWGGVGGPRNHGGEAEKNRAGVGGDGAAMSNVTRFPYLD